MTINNDQNTCIGQAVDSRCSLLLRCQHLSLGSEDVHHCGFIPVASPWGVTPWLRPGEEGGIQVICAQEEDSPICSKQARYSPKVVLSTRGHANLLSSDTGVPDRFSGQVLAQGYLRKVKQQESFLRKFVFTANDFLKKESFLRKFVLTANDLFCKTKFNMQTTKASFAMYNSVPQSNVNSLLLPLKEQ